MGNIGWVIVLLVLAFANAYLGSGHLEDERYGLGWFSLFAAVLCAFAAGVNAKGGF
jgi:hypothetical protein